MAERNATDLSVPDAVAEASAARTASQKKPGTAASRFKKPSQSPRKVRKKLR